MSPEARTGGPPVRTPDVDDLAAGVLARIGAIGPAPARRALVAVVGAPGSGKSTLAARLASLLPGSAVVPMDGFHLDNALLDVDGARELKGAPHTFDADGLLALLRRIRDGEPTVAVPLFDRAADLSRAAAARVRPEHRTVIVEGNWLLLERDPWRALHALFDVRVMLEVDETVLRARLVERWLAHGHDPGAALARAEANDLPNGRLVASGSAPVDLALVG